jgi:hypothetical protein
MTLLEYAVVQYLWSDSLIAISSLVSSKDQKFQASSNRDVTDDVKQITRLQIPVQIGLCNMK